MVERGEHLKLVREVPKCVYSKLKASYDQPNSVPFTADPH